MKKELSINLSEDEIQEVLGGLKDRVGETQKQMKEHKGFIPLTKRLNIQRRTQESAISKLRKALHAQTQTESIENTEE